MKTIKELEAEIIRNKEDKMRFKVAGFINKKAKIEALKEVNEVIDEEIELADIPEKMVLLKLKARINGGSERDTKWEIRK